MHYHDMNPFPSLGAFEKRIDAVEAEYANELRRLFPDGTLVRVHHHRGSYEGVIVGRHARNRQVIVRNRDTGKTSGRYPGMRVGIEADSTPCVQIIE